MRQNTALRLIEEYTKAGYTIGQISEICDISRSTISKWYHDGKPHPRTLAKLHRLENRIRSDKEFKEYKDAGVKWHLDGGLERVSKFRIWMQTNEDQVLNNPETRELVNPEAFAHWEREFKHKFLGRSLGLLKRK